MTSRRRKLYCYVDETGQDAGSEAFVVVAVVTEEQQEELRNALTGIEELAGTGKRKWHKSRPGHHSLMPRNQQDTDSLLAVYDWRTIIRPGPGYADALSPP